MRIMTYRQIKIVRNITAMLGLMLVMFDLLKYYCIPEEILEFVGIVFFSVLVSYGWVRHYVSGRPPLIYIRVFRKPFERETVVWESMFTGYLIFLLWMAVRFDELPRIIGFSLLAVAFGMDTWGRWREMKKCR